MPDQINEGFAFISQSSTQQVNLTLQRNPGCEICFCFIASPSDRQPAQPWAAAELCSAPVTPAHLAALTPCLSLCGDFLIPGSRTEEWRGTQTHGLTHSVKFCCDMWSSLTWWSRTCSHKAFWNCCSTSVNASRSLFTSYTALLSVCVSSFQA